MLPISRLNLAKKIIQKNSVNNPKRREMALLFLA
jgi:hypothetical protein